MDTTSVDHSKVLVLYLDAPLQSWGFESRFNRRTTAAFPTRSAIIGMLAAACGWDKHQPGQESAQLASLDPLRFTVAALPRRQPWGDGRELPRRRLDDYHTVEGTRRASGSLNPNAVITNRHYLLDARYAVFLQGTRETLDPLRQALRDPVWGLWFGRKSCLPAAPVLAADELFADLEQAWTFLRENPRRFPGIPASLDQCDHIVEVDSFEEGSDTYPDRPLAFGKRKFAPRRVQVVPRQREA